MFFYLYDLKKCRLLWEHLYGTQAVVLILGGVCFAVWKELEKENKEFFESYSRGREEKLSEMKTREKILKLLSDSSGEDTKD